ncbi:MAG: hypothetical protein IT318_24810 [Anaerolineales bacterium]|nr:hypothetical protein [Anaerolineales bacterium]
MAALVTIADVRALVQTALTDPQLQAVIDREDDALVRRLGAHYVDGATTVSETVPGGGVSVYLRRALTSVATVTERAALSDDPLTLEAADYYAWLDEGRLTRLPVGARWGELVVISYVPANDNLRRAAALIELVRLALERTAMKSESVAGEYSYQAPDWDQARGQLLANLGFPRV